MTATSAMNPAAVLQRSWTGALRMAVVAFVFVLLALGAFAFGRVNASTSHPSPAISPRPARRPSTQLPSTGPSASIRTACPTASRPRSETCRSWRRRRLPADPFTTKRRSQSRRCPLLDGNRERSSASSRPRMRRRPTPCTAKLTAWWPMRSPRSRKGPCHRPLRTPGPYGRGFGRRGGRHWRMRETDAVGHRVSCPVFVGRAEELDLLGATFD